MSKKSPPASPASPTLKRENFQSNEISALLPDKHGAKDFAREHNTKAPEGVATAGLLVWAWRSGGRARKHWSIGCPWRGSYYRGEADHGRAGRRRGWNGNGGIIGALVGMGIPEFEAKRYDAKIGEGNILISVHTEDSKQRDMPKDIFKRYEADDISTGSEAKANLRNR